MESTQLSDYQIQGELGRGSYGVVYRALNLKDNQVYVLKKINVSHLSAKHQADAYKEIQILRQLNHPNIIKYFGSFVEESTVNIVMEYAEGGDLHRLLRTQRDKGKHMSEKEVWRYAFELSAAIAYLHEHNIIHRDIKCMNVFLTKDKRVKLGDLGASKITGAAAMQLTRVGTPLYLAPELVRQTPYDFKVDVWALGCVLYMLSSLESPFQGDNLIALGNSIVNKKPKALPPFYSPKLSSFVFRLLEKRPKDRPSIAEVITLIPSITRQQLEAASMENLSTNVTMGRGEEGEVQKGNRSGVKQQEIKEIQGNKEISAQESGIDKEESKKDNISFLRRQSPEPVSTLREDMTVIDLPMKPLPSLSRPAEVPSPHIESRPAESSSGSLHKPTPVKVSADPEKAENRVTGLKRPQTASAARLTTPSRQTRMRITVRNLQEEQKSPYLFPFPPPLPPKLNESVTEGKIPAVDIVAKAPLVNIGTGLNVVGEEEKLVLRKIFDAKRPSTAVARVRIVEDQKAVFPVQETKPSARPFSAAPVKALKLNPLFKPPRLHSLLHPSGCPSLGSRTEPAAAKKKFSVSDLNRS